MNRSTLTKNSLGPIALLISIYFPPEPGGGATAAWNRALILGKMGYRVFVICGFPSYPSGKVTEPMYKGKFYYVEKANNFTLIRLKLLPLETTGYLKRLFLFVNFVFLSLLFMKRILRMTGRINLVYSIAPIMFSSFIGYIYSRYVRSFFIYEVSDLWPEELVVFKTRLSFIIFPIGRIFAKISYIFPDMIIAIGELAAEHVSRIYKPNAPVCALPIGVDLTKFDVKTMEISRNNLIQNNILPDDMKSKFIILYAGIISKTSKVENLVYAADKLQQRDKEISFLIVGDGEERHVIEELKQTHNLMNLILLPFQRRSLIPDIISACDICVVSLPAADIFNISIPTKFYEYLACCKPQIGICGGELATIINSNNIGVTVNDGEFDNLADVILSLKNSPSLIHLMQQNASTILQKYSLDSLALKLNNVLKKEITKKEMKLHG